MPSSDTLQFIYRVLVCSICLAVLSIIAFDFVCALHFGDGEAQALIGEINGALQWAVGVLGVATVGHQIVASIIQRLLGVSTPAAPPGASTGVPSVPVPSSSPVTASDAVL
jgi:hypothetical protein